MTDSEDQISWDPDWGIAIPFIRDTLRIFSFLVADYGCKRTKPWSWGFGREAYVEYRNESTCIRVHYEHRVPPWIFVYDSLLQKEFALEALIEVRCPERSEKLGFPLNSFSEKEVVRSILEEYAEILKEYATDVLQGDFSVFES